MASAHGTIQAAGSLACLWLVLWATIHLTFGLQQSPSGGDGHPARPNARLRRSIGTAPQNRPACQSNSIGQQQQQQKRRHSTAASKISSPLLSILSEPSGRENATTASQPEAPAAPRLDSSERLRQLRQLLISNNYDAYLVTPNDEHGSEWVADFDRRLRFISGFSGSNGYALVTLDRAVLFTDGRYQLQAELELDCNWWLVVSSEPVLDIPRYIRTRVQRRGLRVATDARLMSLQIFDHLDAELRAHDPAFEFALISLDLIDIVWNNLLGESHQRERPAGQLAVHPPEFTGQVSWQEKALRVAELMRSLDARHYVISKLDDIAWLLNLRGSDIPMAPLFKAYLLISRHAAASSAPGQQPQQPALQTAGATTAAAAASDQSGTSRAPPATPPSAGPTTQAPPTLQGLAQLQQQQVSAGQLPNLQAPQVVQVPSNQLIKITLYVDLRKVTPAVREHLRLDSGTASAQTSNLSGAPGKELLLQTESRIQVELKDYDVFILDFGDRFRQLAGQIPASQSTALPASSQQPGSEATANSPGKLLLDAMANVAIHVLAKNYDDRLILVEPLCQRLKAAKSELEVAGMRQAHWRDSLAIAMLLGQLEHDIGARKRTDKWTEVSAAQELEFYRSLMELNRGQSFDSISAYGANGAIIHYKPDPAAELQVRIGNKSTYLLDSGGQYLDGTTDITRTVHFGRPSDFERETYTRVLMGAIDMMSLVFERPPEGAPYRLPDLMARRHLFDIGLNYEHGTGHGIGAYSLVHESPALIVNYDSASASDRGGASKRSPASSSPKLSSAGLIRSELLSIRENMFTSVEPGYYKTGEFGIRLENIVVTQRAEPPASPANLSSNKSWLRFEPISLVPFEPKLIKLELLSNKQKAWLNSYNLMVRLIMTQQINHYLGKLRHQQRAHQVQVLGTTSSSQLYRHLQEQQQQQQLGSTSNSSANFARMEPAKFQLLLEQAHRWIMAKTELIPLDVPQRLQRLPGEKPPGARRLESAGVPQAPGHDVQKDQRPAASEDEWSALGTDLDGQRLMLAYMSSLPFNDQAAAHAFASLSARTSSSSGKLDEAKAKNATTSSPPLLLVSALGQKCAGIECDLLLLEALNAHQKQSSLPASGQDKATFSPDSASESEQQSELQGERDKSTQGHQMLLDLFQISSAADRQRQSVADDALWFSLVNLWPILGLALILVLQLAVMAYVCGGGGDSGAGQSRKRTERRCSGPAGALNRALSASFRAHRQAQDEAGASLANLEAQSQARLQQQSPSFVSSQVQPPGGQLMTERI